MIQWWGGMKSNLTKSFWKGGVLSGNWIKNGNIIWLILRLGFAVDKFCFKQLGKKNSDNNLRLL